MTLFRTASWTLSRIPPLLTLTLFVGLTLIVSYMTMVLNEDKNQIEALKTQIKACKAYNAARSHVVYMLKDIPEGTKISSSDLQERETETTKVPDDAILSKELATGRIAKYDISVGQMVSQHALAAADTCEQPVLREGMRASSFLVDINAGVAGYVSPGSYVDILAIVGSGSGIKAQPILSDVEVLRLGKNGVKQDGAKSNNSVTSVTVALAPNDVRRLTTAIAVGKLSLSLRRDGDHKPIAVVDINNMLVRHERH